MLKSLGCLLGLCMAVASAHAPSLLGSNASLNSIRSAEGDVAGTPPHIEALLAGCEDNFASCNQAFELSALMQVGAMHESQTWIEQLFGEGATGRSDRSPDSTSQCSEPSTDETCPVRTRHDRTYWAGNAYFGPSVANYNSSSRIERSNTQPADAATNGIPGGGPGTFVPPETGGPFSTRPTAPDTGPPGPSGGTGTELAVGTADSGQPPTKVAAIPEPSTFACLGIAGVVMLIARRRRAMPRAASANSSHGVEPAEL